MIFARQSALPKNQLHSCISIEAEKKLLQALNEDIPFGDITTETILGIQNKKIRNFALIICNDEGIFCGEVILKALTNIVKNIKIQELYVKDGTNLVMGSKIARLHAVIYDILKIERTLLNFLSLLSGIATQTAKYVERLYRTGIELLDTRKTIPNLRVLEKYAIRVGGGKNHRFNLSEFALVKDNHIKTLLKTGKKHFVEKITKLWKISNGSFEIEIQDLQILYLLQKYNIIPKYIMFDNLSLCDLEEGIKLVRDFEKKKKKKIYIELSGGVNLENIDEYKKFDIDYISTGTITKNIKALDFSLEILNQK